MFWHYSILVWSAPYWVLGSPMCLVPSCGKVQQSGSCGERAAAVSMVLSQPCPEAQGLCVSPEHLGTLLGGGGRSD